MPQHRRLVVIAALGTTTSAIAQLAPIADLGQLPGDRSIVIAEGPQQDLSIAAGGAAMLAVWTDYRGRSSGSQTIQSDGDIFGVRLNADGSPLDAVPFVIAGGMGLQQRPKVAWNGENWLVIYESQDPTPGYFDTFIRAVRVSPQGQVLDTVPKTLPASEFSPSTIGLSVTGVGGQWLITRCIYHADGYGTYLAGQRIGGDGQLIDTTPVVLIDWVYGQLMVSAVEGAGGGEFLLAGPDWSTSSTLKARRIAPNLQPIGAAFNLPADTRAIGGRAPGEYFVAWAAPSGALVGSRLTGNGVLANPTGTLLALETPARTGIAFDGTVWWLARGVANLAWTIRVSTSGALLDPIGGAPLPIQVSGSINNLYDTQIVARPGGGAVFAWTAFRSALGSDSNAFALPITPGNTPLAEGPITLASRSQRNAVLSRGAGQSIATAFISEAANDDRVLVQFLDRAGTATTPEPIEVAQGPTIGRCGIAFNGQAFLITWDQGASGLNPTMIKARLMLPDGSFIGPAFDVMPGFNPDVEALGDRFCVAGARFGQYPQNIFLYAMRIDGPTGSLLDGPAGLYLGGYYVSGQVRVRTDGSRWYACTHSQWSHNSSQGDAVYATITPGGAVQQLANPTPFAGGSGDLDIAFSDAGALFVWRANSLSNANNSVMGRIMLADGTLQPEFTIAEAPGRQLRPTVVWNGSEYVVVWDDQREQGAFFDARTDVYAARVSASGTVLDPQGVALVIGPNAICTPSLLAASGSVFAATTRLIFEPSIDSYRIGLTRIGAPACLADFDQQNGLTPQDIFAFLNAWFAGEPRADMNGDGLSVQDIFDFLNAWFAGC